MANINDTTGEDELIRVLLKRQSELNSLLEVTRAINKNTATPVLIQMLEVIFQSYLQVGKFRFLIENDDSFVCISKYGGPIEHVSVLHHACSTLSKIRSPTLISNNVNPVLNKYDY